MKKYLYLFLFIGITHLNFAQTLIGGNGLPHAGAEVEVRSTNQGVLFPRTSTATRLTMTDPNIPNGLVIFDTTQNRFYTRDSLHARWSRLLSESDTTIAKSLAYNGPFPDTLLAESNSPALTIYKNLGSRAIDELSLPTMGIFRPNMEDGKTNSMVIGHDNGKYATWSYGIKTNSINHNNVAYQSFGFDDTAQVFNLFSNFKIGIGTSDPQSTFHVHGSLRLNDGNQCTGKVWISPGKWGYVSGRDITINNEYGTGHYGELTLIDYFEFNEIFLNSQNNNLTLSTYFKSNIESISPGGDVDIGYGLFRSRSYMDGFEPLLWANPRTYPGSNLGKVYFKGRKYLVHLKFDIQNSSGSTKQGWVVFHLKPDDNPSFDASNSSTYPRELNIPVYIQAPVGQTTTQTQWHIIYPINSDFFSVTNDKGCSYCGYSGGFFNEGDISNPYSVSMTNETFGENVSIQNLQFIFSPILK